MERTPNDTLLLLPAFSNSQNQNTFHLEQEYILPETEIHFTLFDYSRVFQMFLQMMNWFLKPTLLKVMYPHLIKVSQKYTFSDLKSFSPRRLILRFQQRFTNVSLNAEFFIISNISFLRLRVVTRILAR